VVICAPLIVPTVKLAQFKFVTVITDASIVPAVSLLAPTDDISALVMAAV
jgi:hypothetical protein